MTVFFLGSKSFKTLCLISFLHVLFTLNPVAFTLMSHNVEILRSMQEMSDCMSLYSEFFSSFLSDGIF